MVSNPLKNVSQWEGLSHILWKITYVWNHQPVVYHQLMDSLCISIILPISISRKVWDPCVFSTHRSQQGPFWLPSRERPASGQRHSSYRKQRNIVIYKCMHICVCVAVFSMCIYIYISHVCMCTCIYTYNIILYMHKIIYYIRIYIIWVNYNISLTWIKAIWR